MGVGDTVCLSVFSREGPVVLLWQACVSDQALFGWYSTTVLVCKLATDSGVEEFVVFLLRAMPRYPPKER